jgi:biopolymer transport protein TolR
MPSLARKTNKPRPVMNVTPLVDIVLVLLIIFMVVIPSMDKSAKVDLPSIFNVDPEAKSKTDPFTLSVTADGSFYFEQDPVSAEQLENVLREANQREPARRLVLRADKTARYAEVRGLFKICQGLGFPGISMRVNEAGKDGDNVARR